MKRVAWQMVPYEAEPTQEVGCHSLCVRDAVIKVISRRHRVPRKRIWTGKIQTSVNKQRPAAQAPLIYWLPTGPHIHMCPSTCGCVRHETKYKKQSFKHKCRALIVDFCHLCAFQWLIHTHRNICLLSTGMLLKLNVPLLFFTFTLTPSNLNVPSTLKS